MILSVFVLHKVISPRH